MANLLERITNNPAQCGGRPCICVFALLMFSISLRRGLLPSKSWKKCLISKQKTQKLPSNTRLASWIIRCLPHKDREWR